MAVQPAAAVHQIVLDGDAVGETPEQVPHGVAPRLATHLLVNALQSLLGRLLAREARPLVEFSLELPAGTLQVALGLCVPVVAAVRHDAFSARVLREIRIFGTKSECTAMVDERTPHRGPLAEPPHLT